MSKWKCAIVSMSNSEILGRYKMIDRENDTDLRGRQEALRSEAMEPVTEDKSFHSQSSFRNEKVWKKLPLRSGSETKQRESAE